VELPAEKSFECSSRTKKFELEKIMIKVGLRFSAPGELPSTPSSFLAWPIQPFNNAHIINRPVLLQERFVPPAAKHSSGTNRFIFPLVIMMLYKRNI
jgi:hypothetical protein